MKAHPNVKTGRQFCTRHAAAAADATAGSDTSSNTISYAILWLTVHQDVQQKLRHELNEFVKENNREPTVDDRNEYVVHKQHPKQNYEHY